MIKMSESLNTTSGHEAKPVNNSEAIFISLLHTGTFHAIAEVTRERVWLKSSAKLNIYELWRLGVHSDAHLLINSIRIPLHCIVLAVHSKLCAQMISQAQASLEASTEKICVYLHDFSLQVVHKVVHFLYTGDLIYVKADLPELRRIADSLQLIFLQYQLDLISKYDITSSSTNNVVGKPTAKELSTNCTIGQETSSVIGTGGVITQPMMGGLSCSKMVRSDGISLQIHDAQIASELQESFTFRTVFDETFDETQTRIIIDGFHEIEVEDGDLETPIQSPADQHHIESTPTQPNATATTTTTSTALTPVDNEVDQPKDISITQILTVKAETPTKQDTVESEVTVHNVQQNLNSELDAVLSESSNIQQISTVIIENKTEAITISTNKCDTCNKVFTRANQLKIHKRKHTGEKPYSCETCNKKFTDSSALNKHIKIHQDEFGFKCMTCMKQFKHKSSLRQHMLTHNNTKQNICNICNKGFTFKRNLKRHIEIHQQKSPSSKKDKFSLCFLCNEPFNNPEELSQHLKTTHPEMAPLETFWRCGECDKVFPSDETLTKHRQMVHQNNSSQLEDNKKLLDGTESEKHPVVNDCMICTCGISFGNLRTLRIHQKLHHTGVGPYKCNFCNQRFKSNEALWKHMLEHTDRRRKHTCGYCSKSWERASDLAKHIRIHTGEKPHECKECLQRFNDISALRRHEGKHTPFVVYPCDLCTKTFKVAHNLQKHKETHNNPSLGCSFCGQSFASESSLAHHVSIHNGSLAPFQCQQCNKQFKHSYDLKSHMRTHSKEKPFSCDICGIKMSDLSSFRKHEKTHEKAK